MGGAARTDLIAPELTEELTRAQYRTLRKAFSTLPDETLLYPTHGSGSFCSTGAGQERASTLGEQRADDLPIERVVDESLLVGYERFAGWLEGGVEAWAAAGLPVRWVRLVDAADARQALLDGAVALDVREPDEFASGHVEGALHVPLGRLQAHLAQLPKDRPIVAYCGHGERASTAVSLLERAGLGPLLNLDGGIHAWREAGSELASG